MQMVTAILAGDERAFEALVRRYHEGMVRVATTFVRSRAVAEEVAQETWLAMLRGLAGFEGRSTLRTWLFRILTKRAITRAHTEHRTVPFSALASGEDEPAVPLDRFLPPDHPAYPGDWAAPPRRWDDIPEARLLARETGAKILGVIDELPATQRAVMILRDVYGLDSAEVCDFLQLSQGNQRVLLHRARSRVRAVLEQYLDEQAA
jgi:RNA polymerase sigma-70 factor (ECF subfamily)